MVKSLPTFHQVVLDFDRFLQKREWKGEKKFSTCLLLVCFPIKGCILRHTHKYTHTETYDQGSCQIFYTPQKPDRIGLAGIVGCHVTNTDMGALLRLPFTLSNVFCRQDKTVLSLSNEKGLMNGYMFLIYRYDF